MNTVVTSRDAILEQSRLLVQREGWGALNIRAVAAACHVSVGSIYNYFGGKAELAGATVESIWQDVFHPPENPEILRDARACVAWMYARIGQGAAQYPGFFSTHALAFVQDEKADGRRAMQQVWRRMQDGLCAVLRADPQVRPDAFGGGFTAEVFAQVLFDQLLAAVVRRQDDPSAVLEVMNRTLYARG